MILGKNAREKFSKDSSLSNVMLTNVSGSTVDEFVKELRVTLDFISATFIGTVDTVVLYIDFPLNMWLSKHITLLESMFTKYSSLYITVSEN